MAGMSDDEPEELPDELEPLEIEVPKKDPRPWEFDLDNLPEEFTAEIVRRLRMSELRALEEADLTDRQRDSLQAAEAELFAPMKDAFKGVLDGLKINEQLAETVGKAWAPINAELTAKFANLIPKVDYSHLFPKRDFSHILPKIEAADLPEIMRRPGRFDVLADMRPLMDDLKTGPSPESRLLGEIVDHQAEELAARQEQVERERQMLELFGQSVASQTQSLAHQETIAAGAKAAERRERIIIGLTVLTLVVGAIALFRM
jgi:hypothetical protein